MVNTKKSKLSLLYICTLAVYLACINGCEKHTQKQRSANQQVVELTYWSAPNPQEFQMAKELVSEWNDTHQDIKVKLQALPAGQSSEEVLLSAMVAGTTPDICSNIWPGITNDFIRAEGILPLDQFNDFDQVVSERMTPEMIENSRAADGRIYQIAWKTNPVMAQYNVDLFEEAGIKNFPTTYTEFFEAAEKLTSDKDGDGRTDQWMGYRDIRPIWWQRYYDFYTFYIAASGGKTLFDGNEVNIDQEAATSVLKFFKHLYEAGYFPRSTIQGNAFLYEKIAVEFTGPWNIAYLEDNAGENLNYDFAPLPVPDNYKGEVYTYGDQKNIAIFSSTEYPRESWEFVKFLISKKADYKLLQFAKQIPMRKNLLKDPQFKAFFQDNPLMKKFASQAVYTRSVDGIRDFKEVLDVISRYYEKSSVYAVLEPEIATKEMINAIEVIRAWNQ